MRRLRIFHNRKYTDEEKAAHKKKMVAPRKAKKSSQERSEPKVDSEDIKKEVC